MSEHPRAKAIDSGHGGLQILVEAGPARFVADELLGFEPISMDDVPEPEPEPRSPAARLARARRRAAARSQRARDKARRAHELDRAIADGLRSALRQRKVYDRLRDGKPFRDIAVRIELIFGAAMDVLVLDCGWDRKLASKALNGRLLRPSQPPAAKA